ncbi:hypothetical protein DQ04_10281000, partial [Trypanosoma grayi]|uniref:hypothetical protein n=1 Tax=Trypanosoma grayi TaxID=71804 RepID=UPI0004F46017
MAARHVLCVCVLALCCASLCVAAGGTTGETSCNGTEPTEGQGCENTAETNDAEEESEQRSEPKPQDQNVQTDGAAVGDTDEQECAKKLPPEDKTCIKSLSSKTQQNQLQAASSSHGMQGVPDNLSDEDPLRGTKEGKGPIICTEEQKEQTAASGTKTCVAKDPTKKVTQESSKSALGKTVKFPTEHNSQPDPEKQHSVSGSTPGALGPPPAGHGGAGTGQSAGRPGGEGSAAASSPAAVGTPHSPASGGDAQPESPSNSAAVTGGDVAAAKEESPKEESGTAQV